MSGFQAALQYNHSKHICTVAPVFRAPRLKSAVKGIIHFFLLMSVLVLSRDCSAGVTSIGKFTDVQGVVTVNRPGFYRGRPAKNGDKIIVGDEVQTGKDSRVQVSFTDESFMHVSSESRMRVNQYDFNIEQNRRSAWIRLLCGRARFVLYKTRSGDSSFYVETDSALVAAGLISDFVVTVDASETEVAVLSRSVKVRNSSKLVVGGINIGANQKTVVRKRDTPSQPQALSWKERKKLKKEMRGGI